VLGSQKYSGSSAALTQKHHQQQQAGAARQRGALRRSSATRCARSAMFSVPVMPYSAETAMRNSADPVRLKLT